ncbi:MULTISPECIES: hypothetical protein [unclassified Microbacterium]|uniref:hypothetical protein n=1 Tax=unclassified Microbacterium TaxID=2609290 RepID=UPI0012F8ED88|nr:hypothetical protein [Microbacterium sp. MAH-37]MVQ41347.1 hypothetical protein [Microbacterium sp. MAH-37]
MGYSLRTGRLIAVIVLLSGLLGMHVLGLHGTSDHHGMSETAVTHAMTADAAQPTAAEASVVRHADAGHGVDASAVLQAPAGHGTGAGGTMAALCVLALLAGILLLRAPSLRGGLPAPGILLRAPAAVPVAPQPPSLDVLCISRR